MSFVMDEPKVLVEPKQITDWHTEIDVVFAAYITVNGKRILFLARHENFDLIAQGIATSFGDENLITPIREALFPVVFKRRLEQVLNQESSTRG